MGGGEEEDESAGSVLEVLSREAGRGFPTSGWFHSSSKNSFRSQPIASNDFVCSS